MARRTTGRMLDGWLVIDKPIGVGSTDVVTAARRALGARKAGHAGTLDPAATGVLAVAFGEATKTVPYAQDGAKTYAFSVRWGAATDSDDADGAVVATSAERPSRAAIEAALPAFLGVVMQRPPAVSAIKVDGRRAYDLAREGQAPTLAARPIRIDALRLLETPDADSARFEMSCGKGGYVRAVARDLGETLGCLGHVTALRRLRAGPFTLAQAISFESLAELRDSDPAETHLMPIAAGLDDIPAFDVTDEIAARIRQGRAVPIGGAEAGASFTDGEAAWARHSGRPVAVGVCSEGVFRPTRVFAAEAAG